MADGKQRAAMNAKLEALLVTYVELAGWTGMFGLLGHVASIRREGRVAGMLQAAVAFLDEPTEGGEATRHVGHPAGERAQGVQGGESV